MATAATWLIIAGIVLLVLGSGLRTVLMMRASDATPPEGRLLHGRQLLLQYGRLFPKSSLLVVTRSLLIGGAILLLAGLSLEIAR